MISEKTKALLHEYALEHGVLERPITIPMHVYYAIRVRGWFRDNFPILSSLGFEVPQQTQAYRAAMAKKHNK